jgi:Domain of unknown function (DUF5025)
MRLFIFSTLFLAIIVSCKKEKEFVVVLPQETTTGQNTLGFIYNGGNVWSSIEHGIFWLYDQADNIPNARSTLFHEPGGYKFLQIAGQLKIQNNNAEVVQNSLIQIELTGYNLQTGNFNFDTIGVSNRVVFQDNKNSKYYYNYTNSTFSLKVTRIDTIQKIVSGNFSGVLYKKEGSTFFLNDSIKIQQGRFDTKYTDYY